MAESIDSASARTAPEPPAATPKPPASPLIAQSQPSPSLTPVSQLSRPSSPLPHDLYTRRLEPHHARRPSSPYSTSSSRRASQHFPSDPAMPQRLPRPAGDTTSLVELHQQLEAEQEAQVNRLLNMIRLQSLQTPGPGSDTAATVDSGSTRVGRPRSSASSVSGRNRLSSDDVNRNRSHSRGSSVYAPSPGLPVVGGGDSLSDVFSGGSREIALYAAETQMLKRENEMLKNRIRELERQVSDLKKSSSYYIYSGHPGSASDESSEGDARVTPPATK